MLTHSIDYDVVTPTSYMCLANFYYLPGMVDYLLTNFTPLHSLYSILFRMICF